MVTEPKPTQVGWVRVPCIGQLFASLPLSLSLSLCPDPHVLVSMAASVLGLVHLFRRSFLQSIYLWVCKPWVGLGSVLHASIQSLISLSLSLSLSLSVFLSVLHVCGHTVQANVHRSGQCIVLRMTLVQKLFVRSCVFHSVIFLSVLHVCGNTVQANAV